MSKHTTLNNFNVTKEIGVFGQLIVPRYMLSFEDPTRNRFSGNQKVLELKNNVWLQEVYPKIVDETLSRIALGDRNKICYFTPFRNADLTIRKTSDIKLILRNEIAGTLSSDYSPYCNTCEDKCCVPRKPTSIYYYIGNDANPVIKEGYTDFFVELRQIEIEEELESGEKITKWSEKLYIVLKKNGEEGEKPKYYCIFDDDFAFTEDYEVKVKPEDDEVLLSRFVKEEEQSEETDVDLFAYFTNAGASATEDSYLTNSQFFEENGEQIMIDPLYVYTPKKVIKYNGEEVELPNTNKYSYLFIRNDEIKSPGYNKFSIGLMIDCNANAGVNNYFYKILYNKAPAVLSTGYVNSDKSSKTITSNSSSELYNEDGTKLSFAKQHQYIFIAYYYSEGKKYSNIVDNNFMIVQYGSASIQVKSTLTIDKVEYSIQACFE